MPSLFQFVAYLPVVVYLPVETDGCANLFRQDRLVAKFQVEDFQTGGSHRKNPRLVNALLIRPAVNQGVRGSSNSRGIGKPVFMGVSRDSAQGSTLPVGGRMEGSIRRGLRRFWPDAGRCAQAGAVDECVRRASRASRRTELDPELVCS